MRISRRTTGRLLIGYAVLGFVLVAFGAYTGLELAAQVERLSGTADAGPLCRRPRHGRGGRVVHRRRRQPERRPGLVRCGGRARARGLRVAAARWRRRWTSTIFGTQPLQGLSAQFNANADQADALAGTLDAVGGSLGDTRTEVARIGPELAALSDELRTLGTEPEAAAAAPGLRLFVVLLLVWLIMQAAASLVAGIVLVREPARV